MAGTVASMTESDPVVPSERTSHHALGQPEQRHEAGNVGGIESDGWLRRKTVSLLANSVMGDPSFDPRPWVLSTKFQVRHPGVT